MKYLDLNSLMPSQLFGTWKTLERFTGQSADSFFQSTATLDLNQDGTFVSRNGSTAQGRWEMFRENEIIYNPQLNFFNDTPEPLNAIITRFREDEEEEGTTQKMTLYFSSGLEIVFGRTVS